MEHQEPMCAVLGMEPYILVTLLLECMILIHISVGLFMHVVYRQQFLKVHESFSHALLFYCCAAPLLLFFISVLVYTHMSINSYFILPQFCPGFVPIR